MLLLVNSNKRPKRGGDSQFVRDSCFVRHEKKTSRRALMTRHAAMNGRMNGICHAVCPTLIYCSRVAYIAPRPCNSLRLEAMKILSP